MEPCIPVDERQIEREIILELTEAHRNITLDESRLKLMKDLNNRGLCTRDIYSFACNQADLCVTTSELNRSLISSAMKTKIRDIEQALKDTHRRRRLNERELLEHYGGHSWKVRKKLKEIKRLLRVEGQELKKKHSKKIDHYRDTMTRLSDVTCMENKRVQKLQEMHTRPVTTDGIDEKRDEMQDMNKRPVSIDGMNKQCDEGGG